MGSRIEVESIQKTSKTVKPLLNNSLQIIQNKKSIIALFVLLSLCYCIDCSGRMPGGTTEVTNEKDRNAIASKALEQLEKSSNNGPMARKIVRITKVERA